MNRRTMTLQILRHACIALWLIIATARLNGIRSTLRMLFPSYISSSLGGRAQQYTAKDDEAFRSTLRNKYGIAEAFAQ